MSEIPGQSGHALPTSNVVLCQVRTFANAEAHRRVLRPREGHSRPQCRRALSHSTTERPAARRCIPEVATNKAWSDQSEGQARRRDPLCALALRGTEAHFDEGCIELDNSPVERTIRPITLNWKNALFAGSVAAPSTAPSSLR